MSVSATDRAVKGSPGTPTRPSVEERARGCLLGLGIGDALGAPAENLSRQEIRDRWGPVTDFLTEDNRYRSPEDIREIFDKAGITPGMKTIMISGSGVHSSQAIFAMHLAGLDGAALYPGGWSQWCADASNPVERGDVASVSECVRN